MSNIIFECRKGDSLTIGFLFNNTFDMSRIELSEVWLDGVKFATTTNDHLLTCRIKSDETKTKVGAQRLTLAIDDSVLGMKQRYCGDIEFKNTNSKTTNQSVNNGWDIVVSLSVNEQAITIDDIMYNYVIGATGTVGDIINYPEIATPDDADVTIIQHGNGSVNSFSWSWANIKLSLKNYLDGLFEPKKGSDDNYVTDAEKVKLSNLSGTNTGDQDLSGLQPKETGKGLSENDFTDAEKTKLDNLETSKWDNSTSQKTFDDWYLPSIGEVQKIYDNRTALGLTVVDNIASSSEAVRSGDVDEKRDFLSKHFTLGTTQSIRKSLDAEQTFAVRDFELVENANSLEIGSNGQGGIVFHFVVGLGVVKYYELITTPVSLGGISWAQLGTQAYSLAGTLDYIGDGKENTAKIVALQSSEVENSMAKEIASISNIKTIDVIIPKDNKQIPESIISNYVHTDNNFTTVLKNKLDSITAIFTTELKTAYDSAVSWVSNAGENIKTALGIFAGGSINKFLTEAGTFEPISVGGASSSPLYYNPTPSGIGTAKTLSYIPYPTEVEEQYTLTTTEQLLTSYVYPEPIATDTIDAGNWVSKAVGRISSSSGSSFLRLEFSIYKDGVKTLLFSKSSDEINNTTFESIPGDAANGVFAVDPTGFLWVDVYGVTSGANRTLYLKIGDGNTSFIQTPLRASHEGLRDLNGDLSFQHFDSTSEKTTPIAADSLGLWDSVTSTFKRLTLTNLTTFLSGTFATLTQLATKQNTLVSGSNIRTVNGNSLLGSSDLVLTTTGATVVGNTGDSETSVMHQKAVTGAIVAPILNQLLDTDTEAELPTKFPSAVYGDASKVLSDGIIRSYNGVGWKSTGQTSSPTDLAIKSDITSLRNSTAEKTDLKIDMQTTADFTLNVGGGRVNGSIVGKYKYQSITEYKRIRIVGEFLPIDANMALYGFYNGVPVSTDFGEPITTGYVSGSGLATPNVLTVIDEIIDVPSGAGYIFVSQTAGQIINCYEPQDDIIVKDEEIVDSVFDVLNGTEIFKNEGLLTSVGNFYPFPGDIYRVTDLLRVDKLQKMMLRNLVTYSHAGIFGLAFYDKNKNIIGTPYVPPTDNGVNDSAFDVEVGSIVNSYPLAVYLRASGLVGNKPCLLSKMEISTIERGAWNDESYKLNLITNCICAGDSTVQGFVVQAPIYQVILDKSYPTQLAKLAPFPVTNAGMSGASCKTWLANEFSKYDFADYDLFIAEFGYNHNDGAFDLETIDTVGSNGYAYCKIIEGVLAQNPTIQIFITKSSYAKNSDHWMPLLNEIAKRYDAKILDLTNLAYINLTDNKFHGLYDSGGGVMEMDFVHFNIAGYNAKAFFIYNTLKSLL